MTPQRLPSLDGLRALSIALVIIGHAYQGATDRSPSTPIWLIVANGGLGVEIFFVISGFLITWLLLKERERNGIISLRDFYVRRAVRIIPALWAYLAIVLLLVLWGVLSGVSRNAFLSAFTFTTDYSPWADSNTLAHTWSLSVEEQFYLLWPVTLVVVMKRFGRSTAAKIALALVLLAPVLRVLTHLSGNTFLEHHIYYMLHTRMDALMFGCLLALVYGTERFEQFYCAHKRWMLPSALFALLVSPLATAHFGGAYIFTVGLSLEGVSIALTILWAVRNPLSLVGRLLNARPIVHIGGVSYGLYLWQELMLKSGLALSRYPLVAILCALAAAELSYLLVEQPCQRLRLRLAWGKKGRKTVVT